MKTLLTLSFLIATSSAFANPVRLDCAAASKDNFFDDSTLSATIDGSNLTLTSASLANVAGTFEKVVKKSGSLQYSVPDLSDLMDQSDLGKAFISADHSSITLSIRFTDDDGPQSWRTAKFSCKAAQ